VDYTELPQVGHLKYLLVIVDHLTNWVKAMPPPSATTNGIVKILLDNKIPWFGLIENRESDNGSHFIAKIIRELARALDIRWAYHTPYFPPTSGKVKRMNQTLKNSTY
jgi:transposase InsO family protein